MVRKFWVATTVVSAAVFCFWATTHAEGRWWAATGPADLNLSGAIEACAALPAETRGVDRIGCAITAILVGRTALARDYFLLVTDADARDCIRETSASARNVPPALVLLVAYCKTRAGSFADGRRSLEPLQSVAGRVGATDTPPLFEAFRIAVLARAMNGEGEWDKAVQLIRQHPQFPHSDILRSELFAIYVEDERREELLAWWDGLRSSAFPDPSLRALFEAQVALLRGSPEAASRALDAVPNDPNRDGSKALTVAKYRVDRLRGVPEKDPAVNDQGRSVISTKIEAGPGFNSQQSSTDVSLGIGLIKGRGVNFNIDKRKLTRPGVALPLGFFY
jgi:hypothetical protein